jgi:effector-binding domain-containing protein
LTGAAPGCIHFRMTAEEFGFEICLPLSVPVRPSGRVRPGVLKGARVAQVVYRGGYEGLGGAWREFEEWIRAAGHRMAPDLRERYVVGPESGSDAGAWRTELNRPLVTP